MIYFPTDFLDRTALDEQNNLSIKNLRNCESCGSFYISQPRITRIFTDEYSSLS